MIPRNQKRTKSTTKRASPPTSPASAYRSSGVDLNANAHAKELIKALARTTFRPGVVGDIGFFGGMFQVKGFRNPVLVASTDGVGTKLKIAALMGRYDTIGIDLVNHCVNDIFTCGAEPLFFLDYIAMGRMVPERAADLVKGLATACRANNCALIGGETATMPGIYAPDDFDLAGFIVGAVERAKVLDGSNIAAGDVLLGLPSSGLHTNGYSLVRKIFHIDENARALRKRYAGLSGALGEALLAPHRCYYEALKDHLSRINGLAHITGGGFYENIPRTLPRGLGVRINPKSWDVPPLFRLIQKTGNISSREMHSVFNMGIGMIAICTPDNARKIQRKLSEGVIIGEVVKLGKKTERVVIEGIRAS